MDFEGRVLSDKKVAEAITQRCVPVVADNHQQIQAIRNGKGKPYDRLKKTFPESSPRNQELFDEMERWGGLLWVVSPDRKRRASIDYHKAGSVPAFLELFDKACKEVEAPPEK